MLSYAESFPGGILGIIIGCCLIVIVIILVRRLIRKKSTKENEILSPREQTKINQRRISDPKKYGKKLLKDPKSGEIFY